MGIVASDAGPLVEPVEALAATGVGDDDRDMRQRAQQQVRQVIERVAYQLLEIVVVERIERHEVVFVRVDGQAFAGELLGVAYQLFELQLGLGVAPAGHPHRDQRHGTGEGRDDYHPHGDLLERSHPADRAEALRDDDHDEAHGHRDQRRDPDSPKRS
jgi:hypothetical protein